MNGGAGLKPGRLSRVRPRIQSNNYLTCHSSLTGKALFCKEEDRGSSPRGGFELKDHELTTKYIFHGVAKWVKYDKPDPKYNNYGLDLYLDDQSLRLFKKTGLQLQIRDNEDGVYVKFKRSAQKIIKQELINQGPPEIIFTGNEAKGTLIGNGSKVGITVSVYDTAKGKGHTWESLTVEELVPYGGGVIDAHDVPDDAEAAEKAADVKPGRPFADQVPF